MRRPMLNSEESITVNGPLTAAEEACRMVFGPTPNTPPVLPLPPPLRNLVDNWPANPSEASDVALELPPTSFEIERAGKKMLNVTFRCCRVTIVHEGKKVGYALRTDALGLDAIRVWFDAQKTAARIRKLH
jgi:hypothetical protein